MLNLSKQQHRINRLLYVSGINHLLSRCIKAPLILCFHRICHPQTLLDRRTDAIPPEQFERILFYIQSLGYRFISLEEMADRIEAGSAGREVVVTFDDGFSDLYYNAFPILQKMKIPFSLFLITSTVDSKKLLWLHRLYILLEQLNESERRRILGTFLPLQVNWPIEKQVKNFFMNREKTVVNHLLEELAGAAHWNFDRDEESAAQLYLTRNQLCEMQRAGAAIEAHGCEHWPLNPLDHGEMEAEITGSIRFIESEFGRRPRFFSVSFGVTSEHVPGILRRENIRGLCTMEHTAVRRNNLYALPRIYRGIASMENFAWYITCAFLQFFRGR